MQRIKNSLDIMTILIIGIVIVIIVVLILLLTGNNNNKLYCVVSSSNTLPTNGTVKLHVYARGDNATIKTFEGVRTNKNYYEVEVNSNKKYIFYAIDGKNISSCSINVDNIDNIPPTGTITIDSLKRDLVATLTLTGKDNVKLSNNPYSWNNENWSNNNTLKVIENGVYKGYIKDAAGNVTTVTYNVTNIGNPTITENIGISANSSKKLVVAGIVKTWESNNTSVATVSNSGELFAKTPGVATITATLTNGDMYEYVVTVTKTKITSIALNKTSVQLKPTGTATLTISSITPQNMKCDNISWESNDSTIAKVNNGIVTGVKNGSAIITVNCDGVTSSAKVTVKSAENAIIPKGDITKKYESETLKYYIQNNSSKYYLTYIWMEDPYNQIKKLDANASVYGKIMTDSELSSKTLYRKTVGDMVDGYVANGMIPTSKAVIAYNASGFYVSGTWNPPTSYYNLRSDSWLVFTDGIETRNRLTDGANTRMIIGITEAGNLRIYGTKTGVEERKIIYSAIVADKVKNTFSFSPALVKNGVNVATEQGGNHTRQAICQINSNNYVMLTVNTLKMGAIDMGKIFESIGCQIAFNLDGGGSTSLFYKDPGQKKSTRLYCQDTYCRSIVEGIYFTEK